MNQHDLADVILRVTIRDGQFTAYEIGRTDNFCVGNHLSFPRMSLGERYSRHTQSEHTSQTSSDTSNRTRQFDNHGCDLLRIGAILL